MSEQASSLEQVTTPGRQLNIDELCDDATLEMLRRFTLLDLLRSEKVCHRWRSLQATVLREKTTLMLVDDVTCQSDPTNDLVSVPPCEHFTSRNLQNDLLPIFSLYHLVSFLYFIAPRMPNVKTLYISISWLAPEQLAQVLSKFAKVQCLTMYGKPTHNMVEWIPIQKVLTSQYGGLRHFVTNYHLAPERTFDPMFSDALDKMEAFALCVGEKIDKLANALLNSDNMTIQAFQHFISNLKNLLNKWFPASKNGAGGVHQMADHGEEDLQLDIAFRQPQKPPVFVRVYSRIYGWVKFIFALICRVFMRLASLFFALLSKVKFGQTIVPKNEDLYWKYLYQVEELHIPGHFNRYNSRSYKFSSAIGNSGTSLKRLTIGDSKILHCCQSSLFKSLTFLYITDLWDRNYSYLYEKIAQCEFLSELRINFICAKEESTLDLLDFLEEGCHKYGLKGFQQLSTLVLDFPFASLSRPYFIKFRAIFPCITSVALNFSRIKPERRIKLLHYMEHPLIGCPFLATLHILCNGTADFTWMEASKKILTFNLSYLKLRRIRALKSFLCLARNRSNRAQTGRGLESQSVTLQVTRCQMVKIKARYIHMLATQWPGITIEANLHIKAIPEDQSLKLMCHLSQRGLETF